MRLVLLALGAVFFLAGITPAHAVTGSDITPGSACTVEDAMAMTANPSGMGGYLLTCKSGTWIAQITAATPTQNSHVATKGYVDTAIAAAAGGGGATCYYTTATSCGTGFAAMPGSFINGPTGTSHTICCVGTVSFSSGDISPTAFDFPDSSDLAPGTTYTWAAIQLTGFDSATVSISGPGGPQYRVCFDAACTNILKNWKSTADIISSGQYLQIRTTLATAIPRGSLVTVNVGDTSDTAAINGPWLVFASSSLYSGGQVSDSACASEAAGAGLIGTYRGWFSKNATTEPQDRFENVNTTVAFELVTGTKVVDNWTDLVDGSLDNAISSGPSGASVTGQAWTNTDGVGVVTGTTAGTSCNGFNSSSAANTARAGTVTSATNTWTNTNNPTCDTAEHLYCFQTQ
jgi:hypothetical protein